MLENSNMIVFNIENDMQPLCSTIHLVFFRAIASYVSFAFIYANLIGNM